MEKGKIRIEAFRTFGGSKKDGPPILLDAHIPICQNRSVDYAAVNSL